METEYLAVLVGADGQIRVLFPVAEATYVELSDPNTPGDSTASARLLYSEGADYAAPEDGDDCAVWVLPKACVEPDLLAEYRQRLLEREVLRCLQYAPWPRFEAMYDWCVAYATTHVDSTTPPAMAAQYAVEAYREAYSS